MPLLSNMKAQMLLVFMLVLVLLLNNGFGTSPPPDDNIYIVYLGAPTISSGHSDHHYTSLLSSILGSKREAEEAMVQTYKHGFSGFAAKLTPSQAHEISGLPGVAKVMQSKAYNLKTTRSWDFIGLSVDGNQYAPVSDLLSRTNLGEDVIIGVIDTGIWPESKSFDDEGLGPIPLRWRGHCVSGEQFDATTCCNRKLIGAKFFKTKNATLETKEFLSPRDLEGHGTHVSATAAGSFLPNASYKGLLAPGTARGGAPGARIAVYKVCWNFMIYGPNCDQVDILKGIDEAIGDGVDVISLSLGSGSLPLSTSLDPHSDPVSLGAFHAVANGITVVAAAGNDGPDAYTVEKTPPWTISVAASTIDRVFASEITLGNNQTFMGETVNTLDKEIISARLYPIVVSCENIDDGDALKDLIAGEVVLCFTTTQPDDHQMSSIGTAVDDIVRKKGAALIVAKNPNDDHICSYFPISCFQVDIDIGTQMNSYITFSGASRSVPVVRIGPIKTLVGGPRTPNIAYFSSRGPSSVTPAILKPDVAAPGVDILAQVSPLKEGADDKGYSLMSGTSMATPHVAAIVSLLKALHSDWSPAAIRSALVTTATTTDISGRPIFANGKPRKVADPFDFGGGIVNPNGAADPGLVYDMGPADYLVYLCGMGYSNAQISLLVGKQTFCPTEPSSSLLDVNLPSFTIPSLTNSTTVTVRRTVTNVGPQFSTYKVVVEPPVGISVEVQPTIVHFSSTMRTIPFTVTFFSEHQVSEASYDFGSLCWTDGVHMVRSPISIRKQLG